MSYFVTGATGFIGRYLVTNLLKRSGTVYVLVRKDSQKKLEAIGQLSAGIAHELLQREPLRCVAPCARLVRVLPQQFRRLRVVSFAQTRCALSASNVLGEFLLEELPKHLATIQLHGRGQCVAC